MSYLNSFYNRLLTYAQSKGIKNTSDLAIKLGYDKPERLYRLKRDPDARPSFEVIEDVTNLFELLNLRWLITGNGPQETSKKYEIEYNAAREPESVYQSPPNDQGRLLEEKERIINQQQATIGALNEAYGQLKLRFKELKEK
ncbi:hypothetical protein [Roseivirga sp.]|uniref:hypothetical protein n=1 Tax=Roseivirga sp. TaxID=1964215 RepID=UPI003B8CFBA4